VDKVKYRKVGEKIFVSLQTGDLINKSLTEISVKENISNAWINGIGAIDSVEVGYMDVVNKKYQKRNFNDNYELISLIGNITIKDGVPFVHTHITFSDTEYKVFGGHLFDAKITATGEIILTVADSKIDRQFNENVGIHTWCLSENN
jgi:predicted DNA-binding protein with PD1-like motif